MTDVLSSSDLSEDDWQPVGRGRSFSFYAVDDEVAGWLSDLPSLAGGGELIGREFVAGGWAAWACALPVKAEDFIGRGSFLVRSLAATPNWSQEPVSSLDRRAFMAGMVQVSHGATDREGRQVESSIAVRARFRHRVTGELISHEAYERLYGALLARIKRDLAYATRLRLANGAYVAGKVRMSTGAKKAWDAGFRFHAEPSESDGAKQLVPESGHIKDELPVRSTGEPTPDE